MSHVTKISVQLKSKEAIVCAAERMGFKIEENAFARAWASQTVQAELVLRLERYDVGFVRGKDGSFDAVGDFEMGSAIQRLGKDLEWFRNEYSVQAAVLEARKAGFTASVRYTDEKAREAEITLVEVQA